jgi:hypothetical protein
MPVAADNARHFIHSQWSDSDKSASHLSCMHPSFSNAKAHQQQVRGMSLQARAVRVHDCLMLVAAVQDTSRQVQAQPVASLGMAVGEIKHDCLKPVTNSRQCKTLPDKCWHIQWSDSDK